jgi:uncharacterized RDD family membrane protein YckC
MKRLVNRFGKLITASFIVMVIGVVTFLLVFPLYGLWGIDTDILGVLIFIIGLLLCIVGFIIRAVRSRKQ